MTEFRPQPLDLSAANALAKIYGLNFPVVSDRALPSYLEHLKAAGITLDADGFCEQGYLLKSLTVRSCVIEAAYLAQMTALGNPKLTPQQRGELIRGASHLNKDLHKTQLLILRIRTAQNENEAPFLNGPDQVMVDDRRAEAVLAAESKPSLSITEIVEAEAQGEAIHDVEYRELKPEPDPQPES